MKSRHLVFGFFFAASLLGQAHPEVDADLKLITLRNGMNTVNLDGAGMMATVVIARLDNFNAHSFLVTTIYAPLKTEEGEEAELKIIPLRMKGEVGKDLMHLKTAGGADCVLHDFRLLADAAHHSAVLITAERKFGANYADEQRVTFARYRLTRNSEGLPGAPALYFKFEKQWVSAKSYCDVNEAFQAELGVGEGRTPAGH